MTQRYALVAMLSWFCVAFFFPRGARGDEIPGEEPFDTTEVTLVGCESLYDCGRPGVPSYTISESRGGVGGVVELTENHEDPARFSAIRGVAAADFGKLRAYAFAAPPNDGYYNTTVDSAHIVASSTFSDVFAVEGQAGTTADLIFSQRLTGTIGPRYADGIAFLTTAVYVFNGVSPEGPPIAGLSDSATSDSASDHNELDAVQIHVRVGTFLLVTETLSAVATAASLGGPAVSVNFLDTGALYVDVGGPGFSIESSSGHDYSSPVPEPSIVSLTACALFFLRRSHSWRRGRD